MEVRGSIVEAMVENHMEVHHVIGMNVLRVVGLGRELRNKLEDVFIYLSMNGGSQGKNTHHTLQINQVIHIGLVK